MLVSVLYPRLAMLRRNAECAKKTVVIIERRFATANSQVNV